MNNAKPGSPEQQRMLKEADFAFRQALAFCPYSPEAVFRYVNLLLSHQRFDEALIVVKTCLKLDPFNGQVMGLKTQLESFRGGQPGQALAPQDNLPQLEKRVKDNPADVQAAFNLASAYLQMQQTNSAYAGAGSRFGETPRPTSGRFWPSPRPGLNWETTPNSKQLWRNLPKRPRNLPRPGMISRP